MKLSSLQKGLVLHCPLDKESYNITTKRFTDKSAYNNHGTYDGFTCDMVEDTPQSQIRSLCTFGNHIYAGTDSGGKIYRSSNGTDWTIVEDTAETYIYSLCVFGDYLYAGTGDGGKIYRSSNGTDWTMVEDTTEFRIYSLCVFDGYIYTGTGTNGKIYRSSNGTDWTMVEDIAEGQICSLCVFGNHVYAGTDSSGKIYRSSNGTDWTMVEDTTEINIYSLCTFGDYLYAGTATGGKIYRSSNGTDWTMAEDIAESYIFSLCVFGDYLYAGTGSHGTIYRSSNGTDWTMAADTTERYIYSLCVFNDYLYAGTGSGGKIYRMSDVLFDSDRMGQLNRVTKFNGIDDYIDCGTDLSIRPTDEVSVSAWFYCLDWTSPSDFMSLVVNTYTGQDGYMINRHGNHLTFSINHYSTNAAYISSLPTINEWHHVVGTYSKSEGKIKIYLDNVKGTDDSHSGTITYANALLAIGRDGHYHSYYFDGSLADVRIYNRALSQDEITLLYESYRPRIII